MLVIKHQGAMSAGVDEGAAPQFSAGGSSRLLRCLLAPAVGLSTGENSGRKKVKYCISVSHRNLLSYNVELDISWRMLPSIDTM